MGFRQEILEWLAEFLGVEYPKNASGELHEGDCALKILSNVDNPEKFFYLRGEIPLKSLSELENSFESMDDATFAHHVNETKNDFAEWTQEVIRDQFLANKLRQLDSREPHAQAIKTRMNFLRQKAGVDANLKSG
ncbi:MAG: DUF5752 family protein [Candidatus Micrarchaeota archaeon]